MSVQTNEALHKSVLNTNQPLTGTECNHLQKETPGRHEPVKAEAAEEPGMCRCGCCAPVSEEMIHSECEAVRPS